MEHYRKLLLGMVATLSLFASATPVFAATGGTSVAHKDFNTGVNSTATASTSTQATQYTDTQAEQASALTEGWNVVNGDSSKICYVKGGIKLTCWQNIGGWKYFDTTSGYMKINSWVKDGGSWFYLDCQGTMCSDNFINGLGSFNKSGAWLGYDKVDNLKATSGMISVDSGLSDQHQTILPTSEFSTKVSNGQIKATVHYGSTGGGSQSSTLVWYLA